MEVEFDEENVIIPENSYEYLDHPADVQLHSWGPSLETAFEQCGIAMFGYMTELETVSVKQCFKIEVQSEDLEGLLYAYLDELLFLFSAEPFLVCSKLEITKLDLNDFSIECLCYGEEFDLNIHPQGTEVKAITYSAMQILQETDQCDVYVIIDI